MDVKIVNFEETKVAALEHRGAPEQVDDSARTFIAWRKESKFSPVKTSKTHGIAYDDPDTTAPDAFRFDILGSVATEVPANPQGVINKVIPGGRCAVARHLGSHDRIGESAYYLYREWLPASGEELRDFPLFFHYLNLKPETPEHEHLFAVKIDQSEQRRQIWLRRCSVLFHMSGSLRSSAASTTSRMYAGVRPSVAMQSSA